MIEVRGKDVRVGDQIESWYDVAYPLDISSVDWKVVRVVNVRDGDEVQQIFVDSPRSQLSDYSIWRQSQGNGPRIVFRVTNRAGSSRAIAPPVGKHIPEFPHTCTRCGRQAYVGAFEVAHRDEMAARDCPARRK